MQTNYQGKMNIQVVLDKKYSAKQNLLSNCELVWLCQSGRNGETQKGNRYKGASNGLYRDLLLSTQVWVQGKSFYQCLCNSLSGLYALKMKYYSNQFIITSLQTIWIRVLFHVTSLIFNTHDQITDSSMVGTLSATDLHSWADRTVCKHGQKKASGQRNKMETPTLP